jgi:uroporphyrinogen-III synthase
MSPSAPAAQRTVIVTRPAAQAAAWVQALRALGVQAESLPLIEIAPAPDAAALDAARAALAQQALVVFVSANAVQQFAAGLAWPAGVLAGATGPGTAQALLEAGVPAAQVVQPAADAAQFESEALWAQLRGQPWQGRPVLVVRGGRGRDWLADTLRAAGAQVHEVQAYARRAPDWAALAPAPRALLARAAAEPGRHLWLFSSSEAVQHLSAGLAIDARHSALATHPRIAEAARSAGFGPVAISRPSAAEVAAAVRALPGDGFVPGASIESRAP